MWNFQGPGVLIQGLKRRVEHNFVEFLGLGFLSGISRGKVKNLKIPGGLKKQVLYYHILNPPTCLFLFGIAHLT